MQGKLRTLLLLSFGFLVVACSSESETNNESSTATGAENEEVVAESTEIKDDYEKFWYWESEFSDAEKEKLTEWITTVYDAAMVTMGEYPFDVHIYFQRSISSYSPVPYGFASRENGLNEIHFYVNPEASLDELLEDWTAPHEISHLAIPFIGKTSRWFSEGYATFFSRQIMMEMGYFTQEEFDELYERKIADTKKYYNSSTSTFIEVSDSLVSNHIYGSMYWGSTSYMLTIDKRLRQEKDMRFLDVMHEYQVCCRMEDRNLKDIIASFDEIIGENWFRVLMDDYRHKTSAEVIANY